MIKYNRLIKLVLCQQLWLYMWSAWPSFETQNVNAILSPRCQCHIVNIGFDYELGYAGLWTWNAYFLSIFKGFHVLMSVVEVL